VGRVRVEMKIVALAVSLLSTAAAPVATWRALDAQNTLVIDTSKGRIVVEMHPDFAPGSVARVKLLSRERVYDGLLFHRVLDHFVDQTGNPNNHDGGVSSHPNLPAEFSTILQQGQIDTIAAQSRDQFSGFDGVLPFTAAPLHGRLRAWGAYCAGVVGMGRQEDIHTGNSEIFFMRDPARSLDREYSVWGRVVSGLDVVRAIAVGEPPAHPDRMVKVRVMADMPAAEQPRLEVMDTRSAEFARTVAAVALREGAGFSVCDIDVPVRTKDPNEIRMPDHG